jgi:ribosomal protein S14
MRRKLIHKDKNTRLSLHKTEIKRLSYKYVSQSDLFTKRSRSLAFKRLTGLAKGNNKVSRVLNYCVVSGRSRAVYKDFRLSRIKFRELALYGKLYGVAKSSW